MECTGEQPEQGTMKAFGVDFSTEDIADVFATCVSCLNHAIDRATSSNRALQLSMIRLRLTRWGEAVKIYEEPALVDYDPEPDELDEIRQALVDIIKLFGSGNQVSNGIVLRSDDMGHRETLLRETLRTIALERSRGGHCLLEPPNLGIGEWSAWQHKHASSSISRLEELFGTDTAEHLRDLCAGERLRINNESALKLLGFFAKALDLDPWMAKDLSIQNNPNILTPDVGFVVGQQNTSYGSGYRHFG
jgi:Prion-inhibition and propagation